jgi:hypothetical protein
MSSDEEERQRALTAQLLHIPETFLKPKMSPAPVPRLSRSTPAIVLTKRKLPQQQVTSKTLPLTHKVICGKSQLVQVKQQLPTKSSALKREVPVSAKASTSKRSSPAQKPSSAGPQDNEIVYLGSVNRARCNETFRLLEEQRMRKEEKKKRQ